MYKFEKSILINRPLQDIFDFTSNPANNAQWQSVVSAEWTSDGPPGVGSTAKSQVRFMGLKMEEKNKITHWDPPNQYSFKLMLKIGTNEITNKFESRGDGTQLTTVVQMELTGFYKLIEGLLGKLSEKTIISSRGTLKQILESS